MHWLFSGGFFCYIIFRAYQANNLKEFEKILRVNHDSIMSDPFVRSYIQGLFLPT